MTETENTLLTNKHILLCLDEDMKYNESVENFRYIEQHYVKELENIKKNFCGIVYSDTESFIKHIYQPDTIIYMCGDIYKIINEYYKNVLKEKNNVKILVVAEFAFNCEIYGNEQYDVINMGEVPLNINNVGVYFRNLFSENYFTSINEEHKFQELTESNKPSNAFRKGIYLSKVENVKSTDNTDKSDKTNNELKFNLLRCSSNLDGPTDNFRKTDIKIINQVNGISKSLFSEEAELNHVLAQIYENKTIITDTKTVERKSKIKEHSDKTKDMPRNGLMAFCTFYKDYSYDSDTNFNFNPDIKINKSKTDSFDYCYNDTSILTRLRFRLKKTVADRSLIEKFDITLYPNSVFIMSLSANRLYTHEIIPSILSLDKIPTRMGYVIRCSKTKAVYKDKDNQTYIVEDGNNYVKLEEADDEGVKKLKEVYFKENVSDELITYDKFHFSMNNGDYLQPNL
jgi:hypothetical protein